MANTITGRIIQIGNTEQVPTKDLSKAFLRREIVIDATRYDPWTGERSGFENTPALDSAATNVRNSTITRSDK